MRFIYGLAAVEVEQPDGEITLYLIRQVVPDEGEKRAYHLTKENGDEYRCMDRGGGHWQCTCRAFIYKDRWNMEKRGRCKHLTALCGELEPAREEQEVGAA